MCYGPEKTARDIARDFSDEQAESLLKLALVLIQAGAELESPGLIGVLDLVIGWAYWTAHRMLSGRSRNVELEATRIAEKFSDTKLLKGMRGYDWKRKLRPYCVTAIGRLHISEVRTRRNRERIERQRAAMLARANKFRKKAVKSRIEIEEQRREVRRAVRRLPRNYRRAVILRDWLTFGAEAGAKRLGITPTTFTRWVYEGRRRVREQLGDNFLDEVA